MNLPPDTQQFHKIRKLSAEEANSLIRLRVETEDRATEIFLIDAHLRLRARGRGELEAEVAPGVYRIKVTMGFKVYERSLVLMPGSPRKLVPIGQLEMASAAPLENTQAAGEGLHTTAAEESRKHTVELGSGSELFFFVRFSREEGEPWQPGEQAARAEAAEKFLSRYQLCSPEGEVLMELGSKHRCGEGWAACNAAVNPGLYRLRCTCEKYVIERTLVASPRWQTQVFAVCRTEAGGAHGGGFELADSTTFMKPLELEFILNNEELPEQNPRLAEVIRQGLALNRPVLSDSLLEEMMRGKYKDPMLGIYGAHMLLKQDRTADLKEVVTNLRTLLGDPHPDVEALALKLEGDQSPYVFSVPPMLRRSWALVLGASFHRRGLVPEDSLAGKLGSRLLNSEMWHLTCLRKGESAEDAARETDRRLKELIGGALAKCGQGPEVLISEAEDGPESTTGSAGAGKTAAFGKSRLSEQLKNYLTSLGVSREKLESIARRLQDASGSEAWKEGSEKENKMPEAEPLPAGCGVDDDGDELVYLLGDLKKVEKDLFENPAAVPQAAVEMRNEPQAARDRASAPGIRRRTVMRSGGRPQQVSPSRQLQENRSTIKELAGASETERAELRVSERPRLRSIIFAEYRPAPAYQAGHVLSSGVLQQKLKPGGATWASLLERAPHGQWARHAVRLDDSSGATRGSGTILADGRILTAAHVAGFGGGDRSVWEGTPARLNCLVGGKDVDLTVEGIAEMAGVDLAWLRMGADWRAKLEGTEFEGLPDLPLQTTPPGFRLEGRQVVVIGHPGPPEPGSSDAMLAPRVFNDAPYGMKRIMPGILHPTAPVVMKNGLPFLRHDCSTLGAANGSALIDVATGVVLGVHVSAKMIDGSEERNLAVPLWGTANPSGPE